MELFNLLAKLTLDSSEFNSELDEAQKAANSFDVPDDNKLTLDTSEYNQNLTEAEGNTSSFFSSIKETFSELKGTLLTAGVAAAVGQIVGSIREGVKLLNETGDKVDKGSKKLNLTAKTYQELNYAMALSGTNIDSLTQGMRRFTEIQGGKITEDQADAFEKLGVSAEKANGKMKSAEQIMEETLYTLADYTGDDRGLLMEAFFGKNASALNALLEQGSEGIKKMRKEAQDYGLVLSDEDVKNAAEYNDSVTRLESTVKGLKMDLASGFLPTLTGITNGLAKIVAFFKGSSKEQSLSDLFADDDEQLSKDLLTIEETATAAESLADKLISMGDTATMTADQYEVWRQTAEALIGMIPSLGEVINTETGEIEGNTAAIHANIAAWEEMAKKKALQQAKEEKFNEIVSKNKDLINRQVEVNQKLADIDAKRATAIKQINEFLSDEEMGASRRYMSGFDEVNAENFDEAAKTFSNFMYQATDFGRTLKEYNDSKKDLADLEKEAASLAEEVASAKAEYESWAAAADQLFGVLEGDAGSAAGQVEGLQAALNGLPNEKHITISIDSPHFIKQAKGDWDVPYDNYPSLLHRGEMVLTASQARRYREGEAGGTVDTAALASAVGGAVKKAAKEIAVNIDGRKAGDMTTERVKENINAESYARVRALGG